MSDFILSWLGWSYSGRPSIYVYMYVYAISILPLIQSLQLCAQLWYADDTSTGGLLIDVHEWYLHLCSLEPSYGYFPEPSKCF